MKMTTLKSVAIAAGVFGLALPAFGQATSNVVGYETLTLQPNTFNVVGARLHGQSVAAGTFDSSTETTLVDDDADFASLDAGTSYSVEFADGSSVVASGDSFAGGTLTVAGGGLAGMEQEYNIRVANTLASVLGDSADSIAIATSPDGDPASGDIVWVPNGTGGFTTYYYSTATDFVGWFDTVGFEAAADAVIDPGSGFYVQTQSSVDSVDVVVSGALKTLPSSYGIVGEWNLVSSAFPAGSTFGNSGLQNFIQNSPDGDPNTGDLIYLPTAQGFNTYYYSSSADFTGWFDTVNFNPSEDVELTSGFFIQDRDGSGSGVVTPPPFYANL
jgi:hypothetical protein